MGITGTFDDLPGAGDRGPHHSVRSRRYRYTLCSNGEEELYDHKNDPNEWTNQASNPEYMETKKQLREKLEARLGE